MKISITHYGATTNYDFGHEDVVLDDVISKMLDLLVTVGYSGETITDIKKSIDGYCDCELETELPV